MNEPVNEGSGKPPRCVGESTGYSTVIDVERPVGAGGGIPVAANEIAEDSIPVPAVVATAIVEDNIPVPAVAATAIAGDSIPDLVEVVKALAYDVGAGYIAEATSIGVGEIEQRSALVGEIERTVPAVETLTGTVADSTRTLPPSASYPTTHQRSLVPAVKARRSGIVSAEAGARYPDEDHKSIPSPSRPRPIVDV